VTLDRPLPPPLPPQGFLLESLGYLKEPIAAIALDLMPPTLVEYRKAGIGPDYTVVGRTILYSRANLKKWLKAGGTRAFAEQIDDVPVPVSKPAPAVKSRAKAPPVRHRALEQTR
jgi:hypothetical protein